MSREQGHDTARADTLLDDFVRPREHRRRDREAEGLGGLQVDDELELGRLFDREVTGLGTFEDPVDLSGEAGNVLQGRGSVGEQPTRLGELPVITDRRQAAPRRGNSNTFQVRAKPREVRHHHRAVACALRGWEERVDVSWSLQWNVRNL